MSYPCRVERAFASGKESGPRDAQAVGIQAHGFHQFHVLVEAMVTVISDISCITFRCFPWGMGELIPNAGSSAILINRAFNLIDIFKKKEKEKEMIYCRSKIVKIN
jgi:hypothetical protein